MKSQLQPFQVLSWLDRLLCVMSPSLFMTRNQIKSTSRRVPNTFSQLGHSCNIYSLQIIVGGLQPKKKPNATANFKFGTGFFRFFSVFFWFFSVFFGFSILANFDWFNGFLLSGSFY